MDLRLLRMIDANANRAREALRVLEDIARFGLDDGDLSQGLKSARHELVEALSSLPADAGRLLASRDTPGDVGTAATTPGELHRESLAAVAAAAGARLTEAVRVLEESAKVLGGSEAPRRLERLRYNAYELEKRLRLSLGTGAARQWRLCVLITESLCAHHSWERVAEQAMDGGADCVQLREKLLSDRQVIERVGRLASMARGRGVSVVVNDRVDIALLAGADGVHLGQSDLGVEEARRLAGFGLLIGVSAQDMGEARAAARAGADYCGLGAMFATTTKPKPSISGVKLLREFIADPMMGSVAHLAIGGITPGNIGEVWAAGCRGVAVSLCVCQAKQPAEVCRGLLEGYRE